MVVLVLVVVVVNVVVIVVVVIISVSITVLSLIYALPLIIAPLIFSVEKAKNFKVIHCF